MENLETTEYNYPETPNIINYSNKKLYNLIMLDVIINEICIPFVFDTGAMITVISESVANKIGVHSNGDTLKGGGNACGSITANMSIIDCMNIGHSKVHNKKVAILPDEALNFGVDNDGSSIIVNGFLGWDIIQQFKWTIDSRHHSIKIEKPIQSNVEINMDWDTMPLLNVNYGEEPLYFGFDSGNTESTFGKLMIPFLMNPKEKIDTFTGVDGTLEEKVLVENHIEFKIGKQVVVLENISVVNRHVFPSEKSLSMGLLAADIIQNRVWSIDYFNRHFEIIE